MDKQLEGCLASLRDAAETVRSHGDYIDLAPYVNDFAELCKDLVADEHVSFAIAIVFDEDTGIFSILESLLHGRDKAVVKARELCWSFLSSFVKKIGPRALPYAPLLKEKCLKYFRRDEAKSVQAAALTPLIVLLESNMALMKPVNFSVDWGVGSMLMVEFRKAKTNGTLKSHIMQLLGYLVEYFKSIFNEDNVLAILKLCLDTLEEQLQLQQPVHVLMAGAIKCLDSILTWFDPSLPAGGSVDNAKRAYMYIEQVLWPREDLKRYEGLKACLRLLSRHAGLFSMRLLEEGLRNLHWLQEYCTHINAAIRDAALPAYDHFMTQVSSSLVLDSHIKNAQQLYKGFARDTLGVLDTKGAEPKRVSLAIRAVGKMAAPIVKFSGKGSLKEAFHRLEPFGVSSRVGEGRDESLGYAVTLVGAFADMVIHLDDVEDFMVSFIAQVTGNIFYQFPQLFPKQKQAVYLSLHSLFKALYSKGAVFTLFLNNIVWSSLERAMEPVDETLEDGSTHLWRHYVELWSRLLDMASDQTLQIISDLDEGENFEELVASDVGDVGISGSKLKESMFDAIMHCVLKAMTELNLKYRVKLSHATTNPEEGDSSPNEPEAEMEIIEPLDMLHMRKYLNMVQFVQVLLSGPYAQLFQKWTYTFGRKIIELSSRYPLISGFYKLLAVTITTADSVGFFSFSEATTQFSHGTEGSVAHAHDKAHTVHTGGTVDLEENRRLCKELFGKYLQEVLVASRRYTLELLAACLHLCLSAPPTLLGIGGIVPPLRNALKIGLRYLPLAAVAMDALERWQIDSPEKLQQYLPEIVPSLNEYLVDFETMDFLEPEFGVDQTGASTSSAHGTTGVSRSQLARIKQARAKEAQPGPFEIIQVRVQKFLGRIGGYSHLLVGDVNLLQVAGTGGLAWDPVSRVKFTLPFREEKPDIWLDSLLSRMVELSLSSSDRSVKVTASELLQAVCLLMLGSAAKGPIRRRGEEAHSVHFDKLYKRLFPAVLRLSTDVELVTRQLFTEFVKQLIHWFTSNQQKENPETMALLDAILDGLVDPENGSLREFSADCFAEFMRWSVRHAPPEVRNYLFSMNKIASKCKVLWQQVDNFVNVTSMLRRVYNRMDHPNPYHRLGAAMAAHCMYPILRENGAIIDRHIFEMLFFCVKSLALGDSDDEQIGTLKQMNKTVDLLQRLVLRNLSSLQKKRKDRPLFLALEDFMSWLFDQTGRLQEKCRTKCMKLFSSICQTIPDDPAHWFRVNRVSDSDLCGALRKFDLGMEYPANNHPSLQQLQLWFSHFIQSLHWFEWALQEKLISMTEMAECELNIAPSICRFLQRLLDSQNSSHTILGDLTPGEQQNLQILKYKSVTYLLNLYSQVLKTITGITDIESVASYSIFMPIWNTSFRKLLCLALLRPRHLGLVFSDPQQAHDLANLAMRLFKRMTEVSPLLKNEMIKSLQIVVSSEDHIYDFSSVSFLLEKSRRPEDLGIEDAMSLVKGYQQLNQAGILQLVIEKVQAVKIGERIMLIVFGIEQECPPGLEPIASEMLSLAMVLGVKPGRLLDLVLDERPISIGNNRKLTAGEVFYMNFRRTIVQQVKFFYKDSLGRLLKAAIENQTARKVLVAVLDDYLKQRGTGDSITKGSFLQEFMQHAGLLASSCKSGTSLTLKQFFLEILHKLLMLDTGKDAVLSKRNPSFNIILEAFMWFLGSVPEEGTNSTFDKNSASLLRSASISLLPFFFRSNLDPEFSKLLVSILTGIVTDHLLVREVDLPQGSIQLANYSQLLTQLLGAISSSCSLELLEVLFPLLQNPTKLSLRGTLEAVEVFAQSIGEEMKEEALNLCLRVIKDCNKTTKLRRAMIENVFEPLVNSAPPAFVASWYSQHIDSFFQVLKQKPSMMDAERELEDITSKICHYGLVELLFARVEAPLIKEIINPVLKSVDILRQASDDCHSKSDPGDKPYPENLQFWRELHSAAYNCLAAAIMSTQNQENFFNVFMFKENTAKGSIWQHLVDLSKAFDDMPVETSQLGVASETVKGLRAAQKAQRIRAGVGSSQVTASLSSQYMISASLSQEPAVIDSFVGRQKRSPVGSTSLGAGLLLDEEDPSNSMDLDTMTQGPKEETVEFVALDQDYFDQHPCMGVVLRVIEHLHSKFGEAHRGSSKMPDWMQSLHASLENAGTHINVRLFLAKVVTRARKVFAPYAIEWFRPYVQAILIDPMKSGGFAFHYMLRDICITLLEWNLLTAPDERLATKFVQHLIRVAPHGSNQVLRANVDIIRLFLERWKNEICLERKTLLQYLIAGGQRPEMNDRNIKMQRSVGLQLLGAIVASGYPLYDPITDISTSEEHMCGALLNNLTVKTKEVYEAAAELLGIVTRTRREAAGIIDEEFLETRLHKALKQLYRDAEYERFLNILNKVTARDPKFLQGYSAMVVDQLPRLFGIYKSNALDTLLRYPNAEPNLFNQISRFLPKLLTHRDEIAQLKTLKLLAELLKEVSNEKISESVLPVLCQTFGGHESVDCRREYYEILMYLHKSKGMDKEPLVIRSLLLGLCDISDMVRETLQNFWHSLLSQDVQQRFVQLVNQIYDPALEEHWAQISNVLLLKLCEDSVDYRRPIFTAPLSDCQFHDYTINTSWMGGSLPMTPLFSSSQILSSQATLDDDQEKEIIATQPRARMIRATMTPSLALTQTQGGTMGSTQAFSGSALFAMSQRPGTAGYSQSVGQEGGSMRDPATNLRRRLLSSRAAQSQVLSGVLQANRRREARAAVQALERANKVHMMRQYRTGELPDIEIKHSEILGPLGALAQRDSTFARLLLTVLSSAVYSLPSTSQNIIAEVRFGFEAAFQQTHNGVSFVSCVEALCLQDPGIWITPKLVGTASRKSTNYHSGVLLLENQILNETVPEVEESGNNKRHKGRGGQINRDVRPLEDAWLELAQLYKALGEEDIVLGLFQMHVAKNEKTHKALEYQLGGDVQRAQIVYEEVIDMHLDGVLGGTTITKSEIDIWYNQHLTCLANLNKWTDVLADIKTQITTDDAPDELDYKCLWEPEKEIYLELFLKGAIKVSTYHSAVTEFVQLCNDDLPKKSRLLNEYSTHLATLTVINREWDRARFVLGQCYKVFRRRWSALHPLALGARHQHIRLLQKTLELDEFVSFVSNPHWNELPSLLEGWQKRWPSSEFDDVEAWDDIAQNRLLFFNEIQAVITQQLQKNSNFEDGKTSLVSRLDAQRAHLYLEVANGLIKHGAYDVSQAYMKEYDLLKIGISEKMKRAFEFFKALVKLRSLQAERVDSSSRKIEMLQQLLGYIEGEKDKGNVRPEFMQEFQMVEGDVYAEVARATQSQAEEVGSSRTVGNSFLGSAFKAYSSALAPACTSEQKSGTIGNFSAREAANACLKFGLFCDELLKISQNINWGHSSAGVPPAFELPQLIVRHMLKALALDSTLQAQHAVARLLSLVGHSVQTQQEFASLVDNVSTWVFVAWIPQILANMDKDAGSVLVKVLDSIAKSYPQALYFAFHVSQTDFKTTGRHRTDHLRILLRNPFLEGMIRALEDLTYPEQRLRDGILQIMQHFHSGDRSKAQSIFSEVYQDCLHIQELRKHNRQAGEYNLKFARDWAPFITKELGEDGSKLQSVDVKPLSVAAGGIVEKLSKIETPVGKISLSTLSKWLADFDQAKSLNEDGVTDYPRNQVEIPGQYNHFNTRNLSSHVQLVGFDQTLICLRSKQRPKILTMRGSDEKEYKFIVKGGEDLRLDQRIEQLFEVMNNVLNRDASCSQRKLAVPTYSVIPVSKRCGLLQFVDNTCILEDIIKDGLSSKISSKLQGQKTLSPEQILHSVKLKYMDWVQRKGGTKNPSANYCNMYSKVGYDEVSRMLSSLQNQLPWDALRTGFSRLTTSAESYLALRSNFARSLSVVSICGYVAGVGDRHLANTLIDMRSGSLVPIDFGYSFGTNVLLLPVPELIPFRLTAQLTNFLLPLDAIGLLRSDMVRIMSALRSNRDVISAVMEVFVDEPLLDWKQEALKLQRARGGVQTTALEELGANDIEGASPEQQHVELKVENAERKLDLWNPAEITISELQASTHANKPYISALQQIVRGDPTRNARARVAGEVCASVQEQVDCLLDQATDHNLLGRIFVGWQPWV